MWTETAERVLESGLLKTLPWVRHGFGTRHAESWPGNYTQAKQIHSDIVFTITGERGCVGEGDALVTATPGVLIGIRTADCVPLLFADPDHRVVAAAHAGWRGAIAEVSRRTLERMQRDYGSQPDQVRVAIGPCIGKCCFEVGPEVAGHFHAYFPGDESMTHVDLPETNFRQLVVAGVRPEHIDVSGFCTKCGSDRFHSFRRDKEQSGRMVAAIGIEDTR